MFTLPIHPTTGLRALAIGKRGPIWPVIGGSEDVENNSDVTETDTDKGDVTPPEANNWWQFTSKDEAAEWANGIVEKRLARERKKFEPVLAEHDTLKAEVEELRPLKAAKQTDAERWESEKAAFTTELEELRSFRKKSERNDLVREIAEEKGLPQKLAKWVSGDDADSITQSVEELLNDLSEVGPAKKPAQRKPKEADGDEPGDKGSGGGGSGSDDGFSVENLLKKVREQRGNTYAH